MEDFLKDSAKGASFLLLKNPYVLIALGVSLFLFLFIFLLFAEESTGDTNMEQQTLDEYYAICIPRDIENDREFRDMYISQFMNKGKLTNAGNIFLEASYRYEIDPVLLASIAFHETGNGTSRLVRENNNPGGLYNSRTGSFYKFNSLSEGIDMMASNLFNLYISEGLVSIRDIGNKYAPIGADNDPNNLNANWVPAINTIAMNEFGGFVLNCESLNFGNGILAYPIEDVRITSRYGYRIVFGQPGFHNGIDFGCSRGTPIYSASEGRVITAVTGCKEGNMSCGGGFGNWVAIEHNGFVTRYAHLTSNSVKVGDIVTRSQPIGTCGHTGRSTGPHLHFEVVLHPSGERVDPEPYFEIKGVY